MWHRSTNSRGSRRIDPLADVRRQRRLVVLAPAELRHGAFACPGNPSDASASSRRSAATVSQPKRPIHLLLRRQAAVVQHAAGQSSRPIQHQIVIQKIQRLRGVTVFLRQSQLSNVFGANRTPEASDSAGCAARRCRRCGGSLRAGSFSVPPLRLADNVRIAASVRRKRRKHARAAHLRIQQSADGQHGIANRFGFHAMPLIAPQQLVVGIGFARLSAEIARTA